MLLGQSKLTKLALLGMHVHTHGLGSRRCGKTDKKLEKNLDPPIIKPIIRERTSLLWEGPNISLIFCRVYDTRGFLGDVYECAPQLEAIVGRFEIGFCSKN